MSDSYVLVGLVHPRSAWLAELSRWATSGAAPIEFLVCLTGDEVRAMLGSGRRCSAVLLDGGLPQVDRDLVAAVRARGAVTIGVDNLSVAREWDALGCDAVLSPAFDRQELLDTLNRHSVAVSREPTASSRQLLDAADRAAVGTTVAVTGTGGAGASTVAMALAQGLATVDGSLPHDVALVDGVRRADLAMYHDVGDVLPGLPELAEAHRGGTCDPSEIRRLLFGIESRHYDLLLGLRRSRDWAALRPVALRAGLDGLARAYRTVVVDHDPDLDRESTTGSLDIEDRHAVAITMADRADAVVLVTGADTRGVHALVRLVDELTDAGVPVERIVAVVNRAPRSAATRSRITSTVARLTAGRRGDTTALAPPVFLAEQRRLDAVHRDAVALPDALARPLSRAVARVLGAAGSREPAGARPQPIIVGQLGAHLDTDRRRRTGPDSTGPDSEVA